MMEAIFASITTASILGAVMWCCRHLILTRLTNAVRHEYDKKLEVFRDELGVKSKEIEALRSASLSGVASNLVILSERRVKAVDQIWGRVSDLAHAKGMASLMARLKIDVIVAEKGYELPSTQKLFENLGKMAGDFDLAKQPKDQSSTARPFVSPMAWSLLSAYSSIIIHSCLQYELLKRGVDTKSLDDNQVISLIEIALPHQKPTIEKFGIGSAYYLLDELEEALLKELGRVLRGEAFDKEHIQRAAAILSEANRVHQDNNKITEETIKDN